MALFTPVIATLSLILCCIVFLHICPGSSEILLESGETLFALFSLTCSTVSLSPCGSFEQAGPSSSLKNAGARMGNHLPLFQQFSVPSSLNVEAANTLNGEKEI